MLYLFGGSYLCALGRPWAPGGCWSSYKVFNIEHFVFGKVPHIYRQEWPLQPFTFPSPSHFHPVTMKSVGPSNVHDNIPLFSLRIYVAISITAQKGETQYRFIVSKMYPDATPSCAQTPAPCPHPYGGLCPKDSHTHVQVQTLSPELSQVTQVLKIVPRKFQDLFARRTGEGHSWVLDYNWKSRFPQGGPGLRFQMARTELVQ